MKKRGMLVLTLLIILISMFFVNSKGDQTNLIINEIMQNPSTVSDANGEYFEIYNNGTTTIDINGWTIKDDGTDSHVINNGGALTISPNGFLVLCRNNDLFENGNFSCDYEYGTSMWLANTDEIILMNGLVEVDRVEYNSSFPIAEGASMELIHFSLDNNVGSNWIEASVSFGDGDNGTPGTINTEAGCVNNWTEVLTECLSNDSKIGWFNDTNSCYIETNKPANVTYNYSCDFDDNGIVSDINSTSTSGISELKLYINNSENVSMNFSGVQSIQFKEIKTILEFDYNFSFEDLNLSRLTIQKQSNENYGFVVVKGLNLSAQDKTKTIYIDRVLNGTGICIKDAEIDNVSEISNTCDGTDEFWLSCPSSDFGYECSLTDNAQYKITGLNYSGIKEQETYCGDGYPNGDETCSSCSEDVGVCMVEEILSQQKGGVRKTISDIPTNKTINQEKSTETELFQTQDEKYSGITGGVIGFVKTGTGVASIILVLGIAGAFVVTRTFRKKSNSLISSNNKNIYFRRQ